MDELVLRLLPDNQEPQELVLQQHRLSSSILDTANAASSYVFNDYSYRAQLMNVNEEISNLVFLLNGKEIAITYLPDNGVISFQDYSFGQRIFLECYGFVQITIIFDDAQGNQHIKDTEYIHVMVRKGHQNDSVRRMTEYVYKQNAELLNSNRTLPKDASGLKESARKTIESHILLLEQISVSYEENYRYFKMNSRFSTIPKERVDHFEKLQYVSRNTLQYIVQHPEELQQVHHSSGIKIGNFRYQPNKALITDNEKTYNIYENSESALSKYLIADAKFSRVQTVKDREFAELAYKYLFSISPVSPDDQIMGLCIFNGLSESDTQRDSLTNIYDFELAYPIAPRADIVTLTETDTDDGSLHEALLRNCVGLYTTELPQKMVPLPTNTNPPSHAPELSAPPAVRSAPELPKSENVPEAVQIQPVNGPMSKETSSGANNSDIVTKPSAKKVTKKTNTAIINLSELNLDKEVELRLAAAGYMTVQDLLPNGSRKDLADNRILNRKNRREIEARLKQRKVYLK